MRLRILEQFSKWELSRSESGELRKNILTLVLLLAMMTCAFSASINLLNHRPLSNILLPSGLGFLILNLYWLSKNTALFYHVKLAFMILISLIYVPVAWLASPGSSSAMPMYTLLILAVTVLLIEKTLEFLIPIALALETIALFHYEAFHPESFTPYSDSLYHAFDLSINFTAIALIMTIVLTLVTRHFAEEHQKLFELSITDQLTGTYNRRYLFQRLQEVHNLSKRSQQPYTVLMIDINHFKQVNDIYGHPEGDLVLQRLGANLKSICRNFDIIARYGGDEFLIILPDTTAEASESLSQRIQAEFHKIASAYPDIPLALAIGISENKSDDLDSLLLEVDNRLYHKKHAMKS